MNTFATLEDLSGELATRFVRYYSVRFKDAHDDLEEYSEFEKFVVSHQNEADVQEELNDLLGWLTDRLGERHGAKDKYFRHEGTAQALPPEARFLEMEYEKNLRLYCLRLSDHVVVLFNGGIKTKGAATAQECQIVRPHFYRANQLAKAIDAAIRNGDVRVSADLKKLEYNPDFELEL